MVVYHTRYRNDWQGNKENRALAVSVRPPLVLLTRSLPVFQLTLSVNTTPIFQTWYFVSMELNLETESSAVIFDLYVCCCQELKLISFGHLPALTRPPVKLLL